MPRKRSGRIGPRVSSGCITSTYDNPLMQALSDLQSASHSYTASITTKHRINQAASEIITLIEEQAEGIQPSAAALMRIAGVLHRAMDNSLAQDGSGSWHLVGNAQSIMMRMVEQKVNTAAAPQPDTQEGESDE